MGESPTLALLVSEVAKISNLEAVPEDVGLGELGVDSLRIVELILVCDQLYGVPFDPDGLQIDQFTTLRDLDEQMRRLAVTA